MNRRGFLGRFGAGAAAAAAGMVAPELVRGDTTPRDEHLHNGYRVKWVDWRVSPNQAIVYGVWFARHERKDLAYASTTLGQCYPTRAWEVLDMSMGRDWPRLDVFSSDEDRAAVKARALTALHAVLDGGPTT